jgi:hypothetical protein
MSYPPTREEYEFGLYRTMDPLCIRIIGTRPLLKSMPMVQKHLRLACTGYLRLHFTAILICMKTL